jgi:hypothetical protein
MNKKILSLILLGSVVLPSVVFAVKSPQQMVAAVADIAIYIGTAIVVIGWVMAGILYLTSMGSPDKAKTARQALIYAIIGTVVVVIARMGFDTIQTFLNPIIGS